MSDRDEPVKQPPDDASDFERRLNAKLEERRAREAKAQAGPSGWASGLRYGSEFLGGVLAGTGLGFIVDHFAGISPWGVLIGTLLGFGAGTLNIVRAVNEVNRAAGGKPPGDG
jgi:ATP synthase protein I